MNPAATLVRWFRWRFVSPPVIASARCLTCTLPLSDCAHCDGAWHAASCGECGLGSVCPAHGRFWN